MLSSSSPPPSTFLAPIPIMRSSIAVAIAAWWQEGGKYGRRGRGKKQHSKHQYTYKMRTRVARQRTLLIQPSAPSSSSSAISAILRLRAGFPSCPLLLFLVNVAIFWFQLLSY